MDIQKDFLLNLASDGSDELVTIESLAENKVSAVVRFMEVFPEIHFCDWEDERLLVKSLHDRSLVCFVAWFGDTIVGAIFAGAMGLRGTINHLAVDKHWQRRGIGERLVAEVVRHFRSVGIRRLFLFVVSEQPIAALFWNRMGFDVMAGEVTMERDI